ncbi:40S ribosomal protein S4, partial [Galemys pyrenaicus]
TKLCKMRNIFVGSKEIPHLVSHYTHIICNPDPLIKPILVTGGTNLGNFDVNTCRKSDTGSFDIVHVKNVNGNSFAI